MRRKLIAALVAFIPLMALALGSINPAGLRLLRENASRGAAAIRTTGFITLAPGGNVPEGVTVFGVKNGVALVEFPLHQAEKIASAPGVKRLTFGNELTPLLDRARPASLVSNVQEDYDNELGQKFDGSGVIVGLVDNGIDPNNVNFLGSDGVTRVKRVWKLSVNDENEASAAEYAGASVENFTTDNSGATHGTHVAGIMTGSYNGIGEIPVIVGEEWSTAEANIPYYGVAPGADIAMAGGSLAESAVMLGAQKIVDYAKSVNKPTVVNLSLGTNMGPHDGTDPFSKYMAGLGKEAIICIAAGNEGAQPVSIQHAFTAQQPEVKTFISGYSGYTSIIDAWGNDATPFDATFVIYDTSTSKIVYSLTLEGKSIPSTVIIGTANYNDVNVKHDPVFNSAFDNSMLQIYSEVSPDNNRFNIYTYCDLNAKSSNTTLVPGMIYRAPAGVYMNLWDYCGGENAGFTSLNKEGWTDGNSSQSINGMACGDNVIVVGSYISRDKWPILSGGQLWYGEEYAKLHPVGTVSPFTSYGNTFQGRQLPEFCAPGEAIVSTYNTYYVKAVNAEVGEMSATAKSTVKGVERTNYWHSLQGTSMACPYVSGVCALLLQAKPDLTVGQIKNLLSESAVREHYDNLQEKQQWGAGRVNAYMAMCNLLGKTSEITALDSDTRERLNVALAGENIAVKMAGASKTDVNVYDLSGRLVAKATGGEEVTVDAGGIGHGVFVVVASDEAGTVVTDRVAL